MSEKKRLILKEDFLYPEQDPNYLGERINENVKNGPLEDRILFQKDCFCCILYVLFWIGMIVIAGVALTNGDPKTLAAPFDPDGNQCGYGKAELYPQIYFTNPSVNKNSFCCVKICPKDVYSPVDCLTNRIVKICPGPGKAIATERFIFQCVPKDETLKNDIQGLFNIETFEQWMSDIGHTWKIIMVVGFISFILGIISLIIIRFAAGCMVWGMILLYLSLLTTLGAVCITQSKHGNQANASEQIQENNSVLQALGIILICLAILSILFIIFVFRKIRKAIAIMKCASQFVYKVNTILIAPFLMFLFVGLFFAFWIAISLYIYSCGTPLPSKDITTPYGSIQWDRGVKRTLTYYIFSLFWNVALTLAFTKFVISSACASWYFSHRVNGQLHSPVFIAFKRGIVNHFSSILLGSGILAIVQLVRLILRIFYGTMKRSQKGDPVSKLAKCCVKCCLGLLKCFEQTIRTIIDAAWIMMALEGKSFFRSAYDGFYLMLRNVIQFSIIKGLGSLFIFFSQMSICVFATLIGYFIITDVKEFSELLYSPVVPTLMFIMVSYTISSLFMNIYGQSADTLLFCLIVDKELSKGMPTSCPPLLAEFENDHIR